MADRMWPSLGRCFVITVDTRIRDQRSFFTWWLSKAHLKSNKTKCFNVTVYVLCFVFCILCFMFCVLCFMFCVLCFKFCIYVLCFVFYVLCFVFPVLCFEFLYA